MGLHIHTIDTMYKMDNCGNILYSTGNSTYGTVVTYMGGEPKRERI